MKLMSCQRRLHSPAVIRERNYSRAFSRYSSNFRIWKMKKFTMVKCCRKWLRRSFELSIETSKTTSITSKSVHFKALFRRLPRQRETLRLSNKCSQHCLWRTRQRLAPTWAQAPTIVHQKTTTMEATLLAIKARKECDEPEQIRMLMSNVWTFQLKPNHRR